MLLLVVAVVAVMTMTWVTVVASALDEGVMIRVVVTVCTDAGTEAAETITAVVVVERGEDEA